MADNDKKKTTHAPAAGDRAVDDAPNAQTDPSQTPDPTPNPTANSTAATDADSAGESAGESAAEKVIARFGGLRPMASKMGIAVSTIQGWKARQHIPENRHDDIRSAGKAHGVALDKAELDAASGGGHPAGAAAQSPAKTATPSTSPARATAQIKKDTALEKTTKGDAGAQGPTAAKSNSERRQAKPAARGTGGALLAGLLSTLVIVAVLAAAAYLTRERWQGQLARELGLASDGELTALGQRLDALESDLQASAGATLAADLNDLKAALADLRAREGRQDQQLAALTPDEPADAADQGAVPATGAPDLAARLTALEASLTAKLTAQLDEKLAARPDISLAEAAATRAGVARVEGLQAKLALLEQDLTSLQRLLARNENQLNDTQTQLAGLRDTAGALADLRQRLRTAEQRLGTVETTTLAASSQRADAAALALAVGQLREALRFSGDYRRALIGLRQLARGKPQLQAPLAVLEASAARGLASLRQLKNDFAPVAQAIAATEVSRVGGADWSQKILQNLQDIVVVRPVGNVTGDSANAIAARAELRLSDGDLAGAVSELSGLPESARAPAGAWLKRAQQRLDAEAALDQLTRFAIDRLADDGDSAAAQTSSPAELESPASQSPAPASPLSDPAQSDPAQSNPSATDPTVPAAPANGPAAAGTEG